MGLPTLAAGGTLHNPVTLTFDLLISGSVYAEEGTSAPLTLGTRLVLVPAVV